MNRRNASEIRIDLKKCREESRLLYIEKLRIKKQTIENNIKMTMLRIEEESL